MEKRNMHEGQKVAPISDELQMAIAQLIKRMRDGDTLPQSDATKINQKSR